MSAVGSVVGIQEGIEAGLVTGGLAAAEQHRTGVLIALGLGATALGVGFGHTAGDSALHIIDRYIGDGGVGFIPAVAIGSTVLWHNTRTKSPQKILGKLEQRMPLILGAGFAAFEGIESGILTSATQTSLLSAEAITLAAASSAIAVFGGIKLFANKISPKNALRYARGVAIAPALYLGAKATPELIANPKPLGIGIALLGTTAVAGAVKSFFVKKPIKQQ
jgi:hypothetical protein